MTMCDSTDENFDHNSPIEDSLCSSNTRLPMRRRMEQKYRKALQGTVLPAVSCFFILVLTINLAFHFVRFDLGLIKELSESQSREHALNRPSPFLSSSKKIKATAKNGQENNEDYARVLRKSGVVADAKNKKGKEKQTKKKEKGTVNSEENAETIDPDAPKDMYFRDPKATLVDWDYFPDREPRRDVSWAKAEPLTSTSEPPDEMECDRLINHIDTSPPPKREASNRACENYDGILHIQHYDEGGASGAAFFAFTIGMLAWAEQHNYLAWIHIDNGFTKPIWDPVVHMNTTNPGPTTFRMLEGMDIDWARDPRDKYSHIFPGKPFIREELRAHDFELKGTGVWEHYFLPPNDFIPGDYSCRNKPLVRFNNDHIVPGIHANAPYAPRPWRFPEAKYLIRKDLSWDDWFQPQRKHGAEVTERYIRFNSMMERRARCAFPNPEFSLGMVRYRIEVFAILSLRSIIDYFPYFESCIPHWHIHVVIMWTDKTFCCFLTLHVTIQYFSIHHSTFDTEIKPNERF